MEPCDICSKRVATEQDLLGRAWCQACLKAKQDKDWAEQHRDEAKPNGD
jgi:hypothetical protein